jgi:hypothetical protein
MANYKKHIYKTIDALEEIEIMLFTSMLNLASEGELKEISDTFEINDVVKFKLEDFQNLEDANINLLMNIFNDVLATRDKLENLYPQCKSNKEDDELPF